MKTLRVLVPLDQTAASTGALAAVHGLAPTAERLEVELLHALKEQPDEDARQRLQRQTVAEEFLAAQVDALASVPKIHVSCKVEWGDPAATVLRQLHDGKFDFVCMTTRSVANEDGRPGSVARQLFRSSPVPIIALSAEAATPAGQSPYFRAVVDLPAEMQVDHVKHPIPVTVHELGAKGAVLTVAGDQSLPGQEGLFSLTLPTRNDPLDLATKILGPNPPGGQPGEPLQSLEVSFPHINVGQEDAIVSFLNRLRVLEKQQRVVNAPVRIDVITGPRAYAVFKGHTTVLRPDYVWLHMDRFDHIEGADVSMRVTASDSPETVMVEGTVTSVKAADREYDVEVELAEASPGRQSPGEQLMAFIRQHYREGAAAAMAPTRVLIPKPVRDKRKAQPVARMVTATYSEWTPPVRTPRGNDEISFEKRGHQAEQRALESILRPRRKSAPLRSM